jgi:hypothetical protein
VSPSCPARSYYTHGVLVLACPQRRGVVGKGIHHHGARWPDQLLMPWLVPGALGHTLSLFSGGA